MPTTVTYPVVIMAVDPFPLPYFLFPVVHQVHYGSDQALPSTHFWPLLLLPYLSFPKPPSGPPEYKGSPRLSLAQKRKLVLGLT